MTSNAPPIVSPASRALSISAIIRRSSSASTQCSADSSLIACAFANVTASGSAIDSRANTEHVADDLGLDLPQQLSGDGADGDPCGRFACAGALEDVPDVVVPVLDDAREVGVAGAGTRHDRAIDAGDLG